MGLPVAIAHCGGYDRKGQAYDYDENFNEAQACFNLLGHDVCFLPDGDALGEQKQSLSLRMQGQSIKKPSASTARTMYQSSGTMSCISVETVSRCNLPSTLLLQSV